MPRWLGTFMPDAWNNVEMVSHLNAPMLWVHSRSDTTIPFELGRAVYDAKRPPKSSLALNGFNHNAIYDATPAQLWVPVVAFILQR
jgi:fermentation-respiration switch protein FrsA (DUF1100 family)